MGKNRREYIVEANRCLAKNGWHFIVETTKSLGENGRLPELRSILKEKGFEIDNDEQRGDITFI